MVTATASGVSATASISFPPVMQGTLPAPDQLRVVPGTLSETGVSVTWAAVPGATDYTAVATKVSDTSVTVTGTVASGTTTATFTGLEAETSYTIAVRATGDGTNYATMGTAETLAVKTESIPVTTATATFDTNTGLLTIRGYELTQEGLDMAASISGEVYLVFRDVVTVAKETSSLSWTSGGVTRVYSRTAGPCRRFCTFTVPANNRPPVGRGTLRLRFTGDHQITSFGIFTVELEHSEPTRFAYARITSVTIEARAPNAPEGLRAQAGDTQISLIWNNPQNSSITGYEYSIDGGENWEVIADSGPGTTRHVVTGLTNHQRYTFWVRAVNAQGNGAPTVVSVVPVRVPIPENLRAAPRDGGVDLWWEIDSGHDLRYEYTRDGGASWQSTMNRHYPRVRVSGLVNGTAYTFRVRALRNGVAGRTSRGATTIPGPLPAAPKGLTATRGDGTVTLSWGDPDTAEPWVTKYQYLRGPRWTDVPQSSLATRSFTLTGIDNSASLRIYVRAVAGLDNSGATRGGEFSSVNVARVPEPLEAVTGLTATPGNGQAELTWEAHPDPSVTGYEVSRDDGSTWVVVPGFNALTSRPTHTITGLTNGTAYRFGIRAVRRLNMESPAMESPAAWVAATPVAPGTDAEPTVSVRADRLEVSGGGVVTLSGSGTGGNNPTFAWAASPAVGTFADASAAATTWTAPAATTSEQSVTLTLTITMTGPPDRTAAASLVVRVAAMAQDPANRAPMITAPTGSEREMVMHGPPLEVTVSATDADDDALTYRASSSDEGVVTVMPIEAIDLKSGASVVWVTQQGAGTATVTVVVSDGTATDTETFTVTVQARDLAAPANLAARSRWLDDDPNMNSMEVTWDAVIGAEVYVVMVGRQDRGGQALMETVIGPSASFTDLTAATYVISVQPKGDGSLYEETGETATIEARTNRAPMFIAGEIAQQRVEVNTTLPPNVGNKDVDVSRAFTDPDGDMLTYTVKSSSSVVRVIGVTGDNVVLRGLGTLGTTRITVTADDGRGGTAEGSFDVAVELAAPSVTLTPGPGQLTVTWPDVDGAHAFYTLQWKSASQGWAAGTTASNAQSGHVIENLNARFAYDVRVRAVAPQNSQAGPWSEVEQGTPLNRPPVAVRELGDVVVDRGSNRRVSVSGAFSDPDGGTLSYTAASDNPGIATVSVSDDTVTVTGVAEGSATIKVTADDGQSGGTLAQDFQLLVTPTPTAPSNVRAMGGGSRRLDVIWDAATAAPHGYRVRWRADGFVFLPFNSAVVESGTSYTISNLTDGTTYVVRVYTRNAEGNDGPGADAVSEVAGVAPTAPKNLRVAGLREAGVLQVDWAPADAQPNGYQVRWRERDSGEFPPGNIARVATTSTLGGYRYKITGLDTDGTVYIVRVDTLVTDGTIRSTATAMASGRPLPLIRIAPDSVLSVTEGGADAVVRATLSYALREAMTVEYITLQGTAKANADYTSVRDILTIAAGDTSGALTVAVVDDNQDESAETFDVHLRKVPLNVVPPTAIWRTPVTIADNDAAPDGIALKLLPAHTSVAENAGVLGEVRVAGDGHRGGRHALWRRADGAGDGERPGFGLTSGLAVGLHDADDRPGALSRR